MSLVDEDIASTDQNPALLGPEFAGQLSVNYMKYVGESNFAGARYGIKGGERSAWSVGKLPCKRHVRVIGLQP